MLLVSSGTGLWAHAHSPQHKLAFHAFDPCTCMCVFVCMYAHVNMNVHVYVYCEFVCVYMCMRVYVCCVLAEYAGASLVLLVLCLLGISRRVYCVDLHSVSPNEATVCVGSNIWNAYAVSLGPCVCARGMK